MQKPTIVKKARRNPLLADDMGSGKTPQAITTYLLMLEQGLVHRLLVVCPKSVLWNWVHEFKKVMHPDVLLNASVYHGYARKRIKLHNSDMVFTTYSTLRSDIKKFLSIRWSMIILDEVHQIRNDDTGKYKAIMQLQADYFMGLSGTPIVNSLADIHSIMSRLNPAILGTRAKFDSDFGGSVVGGSKRYVESTAAFQRIKEKIDAVMIRRPPEIILKDLPPFHRIQRWISLEDTIQGKNYDALIEEGRLEFEDIKSGKMKAIEIRSHILALFTRLKQQVNCDFVTGESAKADYIEKMLEEEILEDEVNKVVIFSQYREKGLDVLQNKLQGKYPLLRIDGSVDPEKRQEYALLFNDPGSRYRIMLAQITAAGEGINLDGGNFAILFDLWWNEAKHQQAFKRIRRMTQKRQQHFIIISVENTIEQKILEIIERKNRAFKGVVEGQADASNFTLDDFEEAMFTSGLTQRPKTSKKKDILLNI